MRRLIVAAAAVGFLVAGCDSTSVTYTVRGTLTSPFTVQATSGRFKGETFSNDFNVRTIGIGDSVLATVVCPSDRATPAQAPASCSLDTVSPAEGDGDR